MAAHSGVSWFPKQSALSSRHPDVLQGDNSLVVSQDVGTKGAKRFAVCSSFARYAEDLPRCYEVLTNLGTRCYAFFDFDAKGTDVDQEKYTRRAVAAVCDLFSLDPGSAVGGTVQVATCHRKDKASVHVKVNMETTVAQCKAIASMLTLPREDARKLCDETRIAWTDSGDEEPLFPGLDESVYTAFRSFRRLWCRKASASEASSPPLQPWGNSSREARDHFIKSHPDNPQFTISVAAAPAIPEDIPVRRRRGDARSEPGDNREADKLMAVYRNSGMAEALGVPHPRLSRPVKKSGSVTAYIEPSSGLVCPFARRKHKSNRGVLSCLDDNTLIFRCMDRESCARKSLLRRV